MTLLLTILPPWGRPTLPIGLGYLSQTLAARGVQHEVVDLNIGIFQGVATEIALKELWTPQRAADWVDPDLFAATLSRLEPALEHGISQLLETDAGLVGFSVNQSNARLSVEVARRLRQHRPDLVIVFGGLGVFIHGERRMIPEGVVDLFVIGEGEETLVEVAGRFERGQPLAGTPGTLVRPGDREVTARPPLNLLHHLWPTYDRFPVADYPGGGEPMPITLGRGCVCRCSFCGDYPFWGTHRSRSGDDVVEEVEHHLRRYGTRRFEFNDLAINGDPEVLESFCDGVIERALPIEWSSYAYLRDTSPALAAKLRRAGCVMLRFGMESASDAVLRRMRKPHRRELAARVLATLSTAGIRCNIGLMVGFPDETEAELEETCSFLRENARHVHEVDSLSVFYVKPLSEVERDPNRYGVRFPADHRVRWNRWEGRDGSTYDTRTARAWRLVEVIEQTPIRFQRCNIFGL